MAADSHIINDVTALNPISVFSVVTPQSVEEVQNAVQRSTGPISIGGGRFSMGGQTASPASMHLDMRQLNQVVHFSPIEKTIRVQVGARWCDLQKFLDPHDLSIRIMQTYANFTVGGSLSVNVHGRYIGQGPLILSVAAIKIVLVNGEVVEATPTENSEVFYGAIGGYGGIGIIVEAVLSLADNVRVERTDRKMPTSEYVEHFRQTVRDTSDVVFHNGDLYPPHYNKIRAVNWTKTDRGVTNHHRLQPIRKKYLLEKYFYWAFTETPLGKWRREFIVDPLLYMRRKVHWRNFEAGYDVAELEPVSRKHRTYVLHEYFLPIDQFEAFVEKAGEILRRHRVNVVNISARHAIADSGSMLAWAKQEVFAFVLYYKQRTRDSARGRVAIWTRELIEAALSLNGSYYLPYQAHATPEQFHRAYPRATELFALKEKLDPNFRLRNIIWDSYYPQASEADCAHGSSDSEFQAVFAKTRWHDGFYLFLQNIFHLYPEDRFHALIKEACAEHHSDEAMYRHIQERLPGIKTPLGDLTHSLPALRKQKAVMAAQTLELLDSRTEIDGYLEIGTTGRYYSALKSKVRFNGSLYMMNDIAPTGSPVD
ncbi:MAG: FAD-dependent oxidoreductase, partial [Gammaproteobacteria bacterium]|nr:FAD-dependent oxidoreductase [Gammaproteobacteria bacterium]